MHLKMTFLLSALCLVGCSKTSTALAPTSAPVPSGAEAPANESSESSRRLLEASGLVVDGKATAVFLDDAKVLHAGAVHISVSYPSSNEHYWKKQAALSVHSFSASEKAVLLATPASDDEQPPNVYQVFLMRNGELRNVLRLTAIRNSLSLPGDGTVMRLEDPWAACERLGYPAEAAIENISYGFDASGDALVEVERTDSGERFVCDELTG